MRWPARVRAGGAIGLAQLGYHRRRSALVVAAVALAVLSTTLLASIGVGVLDTGTERFEAADRDLWVSGGPTQLAPGQVGSVENALVDAHDVAAAIETHEAVVDATPLAYGTLYVGTDPTALQTVVGVGVSGGGPSVQVVEGSGIPSDRTHYADGTYDGPMSRAVVIDPRTASQFDVGVGDTLYVGGTVAAARDNPSEVVGISPTFSRYLGIPTVTMPLAEYQTVTGTAGTDRAAQITVSVRDGADVDAVRREIQAEFPQYEIRTNREQLRQVLGTQAHLLASAAVLVVLAVVAGLALTVNVLALLVHHQRREFAALKAAGVSSLTLGGAVLWQGVVVALVGAVVGLALTPVGVAGLNVLAERLVGFEELVRTPTWVYVLGGGLAVGIGSVGGVVAAWRVTRLEPLAALRGE